MQSPPSRKSTQGMKKTWICEEAAKSCAPNRLVPPSVKRASETQTDRPEPGPPVQPQTIVDHTPF